MGGFDLLEARARRELPRVAFDFIAGGGDDEVTLRRNRTAFEDLALVPRVLRAVSTPNLRVEVAGQGIEFPVILGPAGAGLVGGPRAYAAAVRAAREAGTVTALGAMAGGDAEGQWAQMYLSSDREVSVAQVAAAQQRGCSALVLTVSAPVAGNRERDARNGLTVPIRLTATDRMRHARFARDFRRSGAARVGVVDGARQGIRSTRRTAPVTHRAGVDAALQPLQSWDDVRWLRDEWSGPLIIKGIIAPQDAVLASDIGCDGVVVSNHGGRQLDGQPATIEMLGEIVDAVGGRIEVFLDGGVRRGTDVVKALCLGARAVLIARPWCYAAVLDGEAGVARVLDDLRAEIVTTMQLLGAGKAADLGRGYVRRWRGGWDPVPESVS